MASAVSAPERKWAEPEEGETGAHEGRAAEGEGESQEVRKKSEIFASHLERRETGKSAERDRKKDRLDNNTVTVRARGRMKRHYTTHPHKHKLKQAR